MRSPLVRLAQIFAAHVLLYYLQWSNTNELVYYKSTPIGICIDNQYIVLLQLHYKQTHFIGEENRSFSYSIKKPLPPNLTWNCRGLSIELESQMPDLNCNTWSLNGKRNSNSLSSANLHLHSLATQKTQVEQFALTCVVSMSYQACKVYMYKRWRQ